MCHSIREETLLQQFRAAHPYQNLTVDGIPWEYIASGQGTQAILLLGGALSVGETAFHNILRFEDHYRVLSPSYPPTGSMHTVAAGLVAILDHENIIRTHILGHSLGAGVAHAFVRLHPERVSRLILDGFGLYTPAHTRAVKWFIKLPYGILKAYYRRAINRLMSGEGSGETAFWKAYLQELLASPHTRDTFMSQFKLLIDLFDRAEAYALLKPVERPGQVLLILAKDDRGFSEIERAALIASYPGARVHWFESGGHLSGFTQRASFDAIVDAFFQQEAP